MNPKDPFWEKDGALMVSLGPKASKEESLEPKP